ncbi:hypothetical protein CUJ91_12510 [Paraburkholderia graminis]|jgi:hypothetical protein|uniref:hypothetical protein n=1 Tax=Paraburkholderia TaxID=1822464 RepID=UPI000DEEE2C8|nr:hypothetical protein [Paraburkholderia graminis]AXF08646.1 hypothetical protein CUJ91_12510 [Paraburkholderia graminis]
MKNIRTAREHGWRAPLVASFALLVAALSMSACADANSTTANTAPSADTQSPTASPTASASASPTASPTASAPHAQPASSPRPAIEAAKARQLALEQSIAARVPTASGMSIKRSRALTLRDSGIDGSLMLARDVDFRVTGDIGFMIHDMAATLVPTRAGEPIVFDDPTSVTIDVHRGEVTLDSAKLTAIFDRYLFQYQASPLRNMRVVPQDGGSLRITGEMHRDTWVPIVLSGSLAMRGADELVFHADHVEVAGVAADRLMQAAHVKMADLLKVDTPIARLDGDDVVMQVAKLTPPPALRMRITRIDTSAAGVRFTLDDGTLPNIDWPANMPARGMLVQGGDVKFMRSMPMNIDMALTPIDRSAPFVLDLYHYREQMAAGYFTFDEAGALDVHLPSYATLASAAKEPPPRIGIGIGSASARFNDSLIRAQQASLAQARLVWQRAPQSVQRASAAHAMPVSLRTGLSRGSRDAATLTPNDERRSTGPTPLIHVENVDFYVAGRIGFHVRSLDAQMVPKTPGQPVDLDNPDQYDIRIIGGEVVEPWPAMAALFNDYLLDYEPRSLNDLQLKPVDGKLEVTGGIKLWNHFPGVWLPTTMSGTIVARDERHLVYEPASVKVLGVPQAGLLRALDIPLASLTPFTRKGVALEGNQLVFDQYTVFPPPVLQGRLASATVTDEGLVLKFKREPGITVARPPANATKSYVWIESGDVKMFNSLVTNARTFISDSSNPGVMKFDLYGYRRDVSKGTVKMSTDGALGVDLAARGK